MDVRKVYDAVRKQLLSLKAIRDLIATRCYPNELASVHDPEYPCINFVLNPGPTVGMAVEAGQTILQVWTWSQASYDEAGELMSLVSNKLAGQRIETDECYVALTINMSPEQLFDDADTLYGYVMRYTIMYIERN